MTMTKRSTLLLAVALLVGLSSNMQAQNANATPKNMMEIGAKGGPFFLFWGCGLSARLRSRAAR